MASTSKLISQTRRYQNGELAATLLKWIAPPSLAAFAEFSYLHYTVMLLKSKEVWRIVVSG